MRLVDACVWCVRLVDACVWCVRLVDADADHSAQEYMAYCRVALACHPERSEGSPTRQCAVNAVISGGLSAIFLSV